MPSVASRVGLLKLLATALPLAACGTADEPVRSEPTATSEQLASPDQLVAAVDPDRLLADLDALQEVADEHGGTRATGTPGYAASVTYVVAELEAAGYDVSQQRVPLEDGTSTVNVLAETATGTEEKVVLVGAHLDSVPEGPGLHDNASGVAANLELARLMADAEAPGHRVRFAFWGAEELDLDGSVHYVDELGEEGLGAIMLYLNLDMVGPVEGHETLGVLQGEPTHGIEHVLAGQLESDEQLWEFEGFGDDSDYAPFVEVGIPATGLLAHWEDDEYHSAQDDRDNVSLDSLTNATRAATALAARPTEETIQE